MNSKELHKALSEPLQAHEIEFRVQSINKGGYATILAYKDARVDQNRLDEVVGPMNWQREHVSGNHNCRVSIWCDDKKQWVAKEDTGTASNTEAEKGLASDSFKRACFNWGIGRELYDYPIIQIKLQNHEMNERNGKIYASYAFNLKEWDWFTQFDENNKLTYITAQQPVRNQATGNWDWIKRFEWGRYNETKGEK